MSDSCEFFDLEARNNNKEAQDSPNKSRGGSDFFDYYAFPIAIVVIIVALPLVAVFHVWLGAVVLWVALH